jgi:hypothetical protein
MFFGLGLVIMFPDKALENVHLRLTRRHLISLEVIFLGILLAAVIIVKRFYPQMQWFSPLIPLGLAAAARLFHWVNWSGGDV